VAMILLVGLGLGYGIFLYVSDTNHIPAIGFDSDEGYFPSTSSETPTTTVAYDVEVTSTIEITESKLTPQQQPTETDSGFCKSIYGYIPCFTFDQTDCTDTNGIWYPEDKMCECPQGYRYENYTLNRKSCVEIPPQELCDDSDGLWLTFDDCVRGFDPLTYTCTALPLDGNNYDVCDCHSDSRSIVKEKKECLPHLQKNDEGIRDRASYETCIITANLERHGDKVWRSHWGCVDQESFLSMLLWGLE